MNNQENKTTSRGIVLTDNVEDSVLKAWVEL